MRERLMVKADQVKDLQSRVHCSLSQLKCLMETGLAWSGKVLPQGSLVREGKG
jgi:hypothetical protein